MYHMIIIIIKKETLPNTSCDVRVKSGTSKLINAACVHKMVNLVYDPVSNLGLMHQLKGHVKHQNSK